MEQAFEVLFTIFSYAMGFYFLLAIPYTLTVGRHFDKWFRDKTPLVMHRIPLPLPGFSYLCRAITYGSCMVLPFLSKNSSERKFLYGDFDFKQHATKFHIIFSYIFMYQIIIMAITTVLMMTIEVIMWLMKNGIFMTTT